MKKIILIALLSIAAFGESDFKCDFYLDLMEKETVKANEFIKANMNRDFCSSKRMLIRYSINAKAECPKKTSKLLDEFLTDEKEAYSKYCK